MSTTQLPLETRALSLEQPLRPRVNRAIDEIISSLPDPKQLSAEQRRGIIARYTAVLEGNFIYWMTAAYLSVRSEQARLIITENLTEEVRDSHPEMLRRFALAANAAPTDLDALAVRPELRSVRLFLGGLSGIPIVLMMGFFEAFIQRFMTFLADLAAEQGSEEREYSEVHGVCDIGHSQELFHALAAEMEFTAYEGSASLFEGVDLLRALICTVIGGLPGRHDPAMSSTPKRSFVSDPR